MIKEIIQFFTTSNQKHDDLMAEINAVQSEVDECRRSVSKRQKEFEQRLKADELQTQLNLATLGDHENRLRKLEKTKRLGDTGEYLLNVIEKNLPFSELPPNHDTM